MLRLVREEGLRAVIVNPSAPVGPRDIKPTPTGRMVVDAASGRMPAYVDTGLNVVHVDDVGEGHVLALERGRVGERYILGGENLTLQALTAMIAEAAGRRPPSVRLPIDAVWPVAIGAEAWARLTHIRTAGDTRSSADGSEENVLLAGESDRRTRLRAAPGRDRGRRRSRLVPRAGYDPPMTVLALISMAIWTYLLVAHGRFWRSGPILHPARPRRPPPIAVVVPARDEAGSIRASLASLLAQDYAGKLHVVVVDDGSSDGTVRDRQHRRSRPSRPPCERRRRSQAAARLERQARRDRARHRGRGPRRRVHPA